MGGGQHSQLCTRFLFDIFRTENQMPMPPTTSISQKKKILSLSQGGGGEKYIKINNKAKGKHNERGRGKREKKKRKETPRPGQTFIDFYDMYLNSDPFLLQTSRILGRQRNLSPRRRRKR